MKNCIDFALRREAQKKLINVVSFSIVAIGLFLTPLSLNAGSKSVSISDASYLEGNNGSTIFNFTVTATDNPAGGETVEYTTSDGTATLADNDYVGVTNGVLTFTKSVKTATISIEVVGDTNVESHENFTVTLSNPSGGSIANINDGIGIGTIANDDLSAVDDTVSAASHTAVSGNVLTNDSDPNANAIFVSNPGTYTLTYGSLVINTDGSFTYTPGYFTGVSETYIYTISNADGATGSATLLINIASGCTDTGISNAERDFCLRKQTVLFGDMVTVGNTVLVPPNPQNSTSCSGYTTGAYYVDSPNGEENHELYLCNYKPDSYTNATSAQVIVPAGSTIKWAGLYLQSIVKQSDAASLSSMDVKIKNGSSSYVSAGTPTIINHHQYFNANSTLYNSYSAFFDVTGVLATNNWVDGVYTVANVPVTTDNFVGSIVQGKYGAWTLVVIYENVNESLKSFSVYDGWQQITGFNSTNITISDFYTPTSGPINSKVSVFTAEGDKYRTGDTFQVRNASNNTWVNLGAIPTNAFDSRIMSTGIRIPSLNNNQGIDIETYEVGTTGYDVLANSQSSIDFRFPGSSDYYMPSMLSFATEVYQPRVCYYEDLYQDGVKLTTPAAEVEYGSDIQAKVFLTNDMNETAEKVLIYRTFDAMLPYVSDSTYVNNNNPVQTSYTTTPVSDALDSDIFDYSDPLSLFSLHLGTGATFEEGGDFVYGQTAAFDYSFTANYEENTSMVYQVAYVVPSIGYKYEGELVKCEDFNNSFWGRRPVSTFVSDVDAVDVDENATYDTAPVIKTKIAGQTPVTLTAVYLDPATGARKNYDGSVFNNYAPLQVLMYRSTDSSCSDQLPLAEPVAGSPAGEPVIAQIAGGSDSANSNSFIMKRVGSAVTYVKIVYADWTNILNDLDSASSCFNNSNMSANFEGLPQCLNSLASNSGISQELKSKYPNIATTCLGQIDPDGNPLLSACDSNAYNAGGSVGGIVPSRYDHAYGCLACILDAVTDNEACSKDGFAIRPEQFNINSTNMSYPDLLRAGQNYDLTIDAVNFASNTNTVDYNQTYGNLNIANPIKYYANGNSEINTTLLPGTASWGSEFNITNGYTTVGGVLGVAPYAYDEVGDITIHIEDANFAAIDNDDTPQTCDANGTKICGDQNATFIPHHFDVSATLVNRAGGNTFTYLSTDLNMSARYNVTITAENAAGATTTNFRMGALYYENPVSVHVTAPTVTGVGAAVIHDVEPPALLGFVLGVGGVLWNDVNDSLQLSFNYPRTTNVPVNPFIVDGNQTTVDANSTYAGTAPEGIAIINGTDLANANATFVYGRAHMARTRAMCTPTGTPPSCTGNITFFYEFYGDEDANRTLITNLLGASPQRSVDSVNWYRNSLHNTSSDGNVSATTQMIPGVTTPLVFVTADHIGQITSKGYTYDGTKGYPYKATINISNSTANGAPSWLIYDKYQVDPATSMSGQLEYYGPGTWSSNTEGATGTLTDTKTNKQKNTNRRIRW